LTEIAVTAPISFAVGWVVGFVVGARFRISKRNDDQGGWR
jgi:hypothetical protein